MRLILAAAAVFCLAGCTRSDDALRDFKSRQVVLPSGKKISAEVMTDPMDMTRGMMFRDSLSRDRGMLFIHGSPGNYAYWMYQVKIPLDIIWLDPNRRVVEISANTPPCTKSSARECPNYGGKEKALYILELAGGEAAKNNVQVGSVLDF